MGGIHLPTASLPFAKDAKTNKVESLYFDETETMGTQWWKLRQMEKEYYLQIVTGERDIDAFDEFVTKWYETEARLSQEAGSRCNDGPTCSKPLKALRAFCHNYWVTILTDT